MKKNKKTLIFFSKNMNIGGMEKALLILLNSLVKEGYGITLILEEKKGDLLEYLNPNIKIEEYSLCTSTNIIRRKATNFLKRIIWMARNKNKYDFSCNYATYSYIGSKLAQISSKNSSIYIHSDYYNMLKKNIVNIKHFFQPHKMKNFNHIFFVSNESKENFLKIYPKYEKVSSVINNLIDYENVLKCSKEKCNLKIDKKNVNFIFIGRLDNDSKNLELLIESFKNIEGLSNKQKLYIVGNGPYEKEVRNFIKKNQLKNIILVGETINPYCYLQACDCLILTSNYEGFPVVYLEALLLNKRIMTTIPTSDESIDIRDFCIKIERNIEDITKKILMFEKKNSKYNLNIEKMNKNKIKKIMQKIEV